MLLNHTSLNFGGASTKTGAVSAAALRVVEVCNPTDEPITATDFKLERIFPSLDSSRPSNAAFMVIEPPHLLASGGRVVVIQPKSKLKIVVRFTPSQHMMYQSTLYFRTQLELFGDASGDDATATSSVLLEGYGGVSNIVLHSQHPRRTEPP